MTFKKEQILSTALELFSQNGFANTSTKSVATAAGVSEGLIFRHFDNKEGLLNAVMELGKEKAKAIFKPISEMTDELEKLKFILQIPFNVPPNEYAFWKLLYGLKWQADEYDREISNQIKTMLIQIFHKLDYKSPALEAEFAIMLFDGIATSILLKGVENKEKMQQLIFKKYNIIHE